MRIAAQCKTGADARGRWSSRPLFVTAWTVRGFKYTTPDEFHFGVVQVSQLRSLTVEIVTSRVLRGTAPVWLRIGDARARFGVTSASRVKWHDEPVEWTYRLVSNGNAEAFYRALKGV